MFYETMLIMVCSGTIATYEDDKIQFSPNNWEKVIALDNNRRSILYNGAYIPLVNMRNNLFKISRDFTENGASVRYIGGYDYNTNRFEIQELRTYANLHKSSISISAECKDPYGRN